MTEQRDALMRVLDEATEFLGGLDDRPVPSRNDVDKVAAALGRPLPDDGEEPLAVIEELIALAKEMREADARGDELGLSSDELAFYDALETNASAVAVLGDPVLREIAREPADPARKKVAVDVAVRGKVKAPPPVPGPFRYADQPDQDANQLTLVAGHQRGEGRIVAASGELDQARVAGILKPRPIDPGPGGPGRWTGFGTSHLGIGRLPHRVFLPSCTIITSARRGALAAAGGSAPCTWGRRAAARARDAGRVAAC